MSRGYVLHHTHLRQSDHKALSEAAQNHDEVVSLFVIDPHFYEDGLACDARIQFMHECLADLDVTLRYGDPVDVVSSLDNVYMLHTPTSRYGLKRNNKLLDEGVTFLAGDGMVRQDPTRDSWSDTIEEWLKADPYPSVEVTTEDSDVTLKWVEDEHSISPEKEDVLPGGREAALTQLDDFCANTSYAGSISEPTRDAGVSDLSPYLRFGCVSLREVYQQTTERLSGRDKSMYTSRLYWNKHYRQKLLDWPGWTEKAVNPVMRDFGEWDKDLHEAFVAGKTGYPMVDAAVRCLRETGWLNFRSRAMCATFYGKLLQLPWKRGADWMYYHLIDADAGINYSQWQHQTGRVGTNLYRIYNPRKQARDSDTANEWIRRWVPELRELPADYYPQPEKTPQHIQQECGVSIGDDYPYPIVEYEAARHRVTERFESLEDDAQAALNKSTVQKRASFSRRGMTTRTSSTTDTSNDSPEQTGLSDF